MHTRKEGIVDARMEHSDTEDIQTVCKKIAKSARPEKIKTSMLLQHLSI